MNSMYDRIASGYSITPVEPSKTGYTGAKLDQYTYLWNQFKKQQALSNTKSQELLDFINTYRLTFGSSPTL